MQFNTSTKTENTGFEKPHIEEGIYVAELQEVKEISEGQYGPRVAFVYNIEEKDVSLALICYQPKNGATPDNKLGQTLQAHGVKLEDGGQADTDNLPQKKVRAWVEDFQPKDAEGNTTGDKASTISKVKPLTEQPGNN